MNIITAEIIIAITAIIMAKVIIGLISLSVYQSSVPAIIDHDIFEVPILIGSTAICKYPLKIGA